jgi:NADPH:quinone reductase-like Zn-dependent oxidoreductase
MQPGPATGEEAEVRAVTVNEYGGTPAVTDLPTPKPGPWQVLIKMNAAGLNPMDGMLASGDWKPAPATFPMVLGADGAGVVDALGEGSSRYSIGEQLFGRLLVAPIGSAGTYAEYVAVAEDAPLAAVPDGIDSTVAAALPTAGGTGLAVVEMLEPLRDKTVLVVGAGGGVGSFATQFASSAGAHVIANVFESAAARMRSYGVIETIDHTRVPLPDAIRSAHPDGIDALIDPVSHAEAFAELASLVRDGGSALTTKYLANVDALGAAGVTGINFALQQSSDLLARVVDALATRRISAPPITQISLDEAPAALTAERNTHADGKTVITF